jgi:hypothetical protein
MRLIAAVGRGLEASVLARYGGLVNCSALSKEEPCQVSSRRSVPPVAGDDAAGTDGSLLPLHRSTRSRR